MVLLQIFGQCLRDVMCKALTPCFENDGDGRPFGRARSVTSFGRVSSLYVPFNVGIITKAFIGGRLWHGHGKWPSYTRLEFEQSERLAHLLVLGPILLLTLSPAIGDSLALRAALELPDLLLEGVTVGVSARAARVRRVFFDDALPFCTCQSHFIAVFVQRLVPCSSPSHKLRTVEIPVHVLPKEGFVKLREATGVHESVPRVHARFRTRICPHLLKKHG
jgi:hypothetical protein